MRSFCKWDCIGVRDLQGASDAMLPLELKRILCSYDSELTFQLVKMCGVRGAVERWSMGSWCLVSVPADLLCI